MLIHSVAIAQYALVSTTIGDFRVCQQGDVRWFKESQYGYYIYEYVSENESAEAGLTLEEYKEISARGLRMLSIGY